jgi:uncharacterized membrane protein
MAYALLKTVHLLSVVVWIGGMFFAHFCLRPAAMTLAPPQRLPLMAMALGRFFQAVSVAIVLILASGGWMLWRVASTTKATGGPFNMPLEWHVMVGLGIVMMLIFGHIRFALYPRLRRAVAASDWPAGGEALASIRGWVAINLTIGIVIVLVTLMGTAT